MFKISCYVIILFTLIYFSTCNDKELKSNLRRLSIPITGTSYYDGSIQTFDPISTSSIYSPSKLPKLYFYPRNINEKEENSEATIELNDTDIVGSNNLSDDIDISLKHKLRLIFANKIIQNNPALYPFYLEFKNISSCVCEVNLDKIKEIKENFDSNYNYNFTIFDLPPDCLWSESTKDIFLETKEVSKNSFTNDEMNNVSNNKKEQFKENERKYETESQLEVRNLNDTKDEYRKSEDIKEYIDSNEYQINDGEILNHDDINLIRTKVNQINETRSKDTYENLNEYKHNEDKNTKENKECNLNEKSQGENINDKYINEEINNVNEDSNTEINTKKESHDEKKEINQKENNKQDNEQEVIKQIENSINDDNKEENVENSIFEENSKEETKDENEKDLYKIMKFSNVILQSLNNFMTCIYRIPVDLTPWKKNNITIQNFEDKNSTNGTYWFNYTSANSDIWNNFDFKNQSNNIANQTKFSIEGFWDLIRSIPFRVLNRLDVEDENTFIMCSNVKDEEDMKLLDDYVSSLNISTDTVKFSSLNILPYNISYCSRPTGAELDMIGICPSNGLNSVYDKDTKSCISVTYTDSIANCPKNYIHSRLWGSHRGGGGCHTKERKYLPTIPKCDPPFIYNEPRRTCIIETFSPGFPGCTEGSIYYDLQTCIMAYQVSKEYTCPEGYSAIFEEDYFDRYASSVENRIEVLNKSKIDFQNNYIDSIKYPMMTRIVEDYETGPQSKYITKKFIKDKNQIKCIKKTFDNIKYNGFGAPYCQNNTYTLKYNYTNSWMYEDHPKPYCEYQDIKYVDYKCPKGTVSYDVYISSGNDPPIVFRPEFNNPFDTCIDVKIVPIQPKCMTTDELPYIKIREPNNPFEKTGIHIVSNEDIKNIDKETLINPNEILDNSMSYFDYSENKKSFYSKLEKSDTNEMFLEMPSYGNKKNNSLTEFISLNQKIFNSSSDINKKEMFNETNRKLIEITDEELSLNERIYRRPPIQPIKLYDAILGRTNYIIEIICLKIITAKPYLSCPENTVLVSTNTCKMKGYTDFRIECPSGYKLDEEALFLMPQEYYRKSPPRCVSKQKVFTHYYCPPLFPENVFRPFIINNTNLDLILNNTNKTLTNDYSNATLDSQLNIASNSNNTIFNETEFKNQNDTFKLNIKDIRVFSERSYGRTIVPSYSQKMCHEVDLIKPIWVMPLLLIKLMSNVNSE